MSDSSVQDFLRKHKYPAHLIKEGRLGLVRRWKEFVEQVERGYSLGIEDYRNDLDIRSIIKRSGAADDEVHALDSRLKKLLTGNKSRVWEDEEAGESGAAKGDADENFWCFGHPRNAGPDLMSDLHREGLVEKEKKASKK